MKQSVYKRLVLAVMVAVGLLLAPLAVPAMAADHASMMTQMDDMTCCPNHKAPANEPCKDCALMAICGLKLVQAFVLSDAVTLLTPVSLGRMIAGNDNISDHLVGSPPARPPRLSA